MGNSAEEVRNPDGAQALLFVYGTLMRGGKRHRSLAGTPDIRFLGEARIHAELYSLRGEDYPAAVPTSERNRFVYGELYALDDPDRILKRLDKIEGCDEGLFERRLADVWRHGIKRKAWTYFYSRSVSSAEHLPHGKFLVEYPTA